MPVTGSLKRKIQLSVERSFVRVLIAGSETQLASGGVAVPGPPDGVGLVDAVAVGVPIGVDVGVAVGVDVGVADGVGVGVPGAVTTTERPEPQRVLPPGPVAIRYTV
jgi:hypothetical protein